MATVHPGKVQINDPSVTLTGYSDTNRTRFLYTGAQFVKANLVNPKANLAYVYSLTTGGPWEEYKDLNGLFALVNSEKYIPIATGAPDPTKANEVVVGFPEQVTTSTIYFWSPSFFDTSTIQVSYSYDGSTYFSIGAASISNSFDATIQQREGESPPLGQYEYEVTLGASYTARYFKLSTASISWVQLVSEIEIVQNLGALLEIWDTDGSQAAPQTLEFDYYYDIVYDRYYDKYFTIRENTDFAGTAGSFELGDDFTYTTSTFNTTRWQEAVSDGGFQINTTSGTAECRTPNDRGRLKTMYYLEGDFTSDIHMGFNTFSGDNSRLEIRAIDKDYNNLVAQMGYRGPWSVSSPYGQWEAINVRKTIDTTAGTAYLSALRLNTTHSPDGASSVQMVYDSVSDVWTVTSGGGGTLGNITPGVSYSEGPFDGVSLVHAGTPLNGATIELSFDHQLYAATSSSPWTWRIGLEKSTDSLFCRYDPGTGAFVNWITYSDASSYDFNLELFADNSGLSSDLTVDNFTTSGTGYWNDIPVLAVEVVNEVGNRTPVAGFTDSDGYLIKRLDVINEVSEYYDWGSGRIQMATDGLSAGSAGHLYLKIGTNIYDYTKSSFPLDQEDGSTASNSKLAVISETLGGNFEYNAYSNAGLCYVAYDAGRAGTYVYTLGTSTLSGTDYESRLDLSSANYPFAWDLNNYDALYYVDSTSLKFFNMDETDVAFCNVSSDDKIMSAGSGDTTAVDATVLNVYGEPLQSKTVTFSVSAGDGAISPATDCTTASGVATSVYTVGSTVGTSTITATASDIAC